MRVLLGRGDGDEPNSRPSHSKIVLVPLYSTYISDLDRDNVAFGIVLEGDGIEFLKYCADLPTYAGERPMTQDEGAVQDAAKAVLGCRIAINSYVEN